MQTFTCFLALVLVAGVIASAQSTEKPDLRQDLLRELKYAQKRAIELAEAIPAEKYSWRPAEGVRSIGETMMHLVVNKHYLLSFTGIPAPEGMNVDLEKTVTGKAEIVKMLREAYKKAIDTIEQSDPKDWDEPVDFFWKPATRRTIYTRLVIHSNEHVGQLIGYARTNGIAPPWSR